MAVCRRLPSPPGLGKPRHLAPALADTGFGEVEILGVDASDSISTPDRGVILARGPAEVKEAPGVWVLAGDHGGVAHALAAELAAHNQTVVLAGAEASPGGESTAEAPAVIRASVDAQSRKSWRSLLERLPADAPLSGIVHLAALDGRGEDAGTEALGEDAKQAGGSALALVQGIADADATPAKGVWFVTRGGQVLERERRGELAGAMLWGLGRVVARETPHLNPRMIDLDPAGAAPTSDLVNELMYPDAETHLAYRTGRRQAARLVRAGTDTERLALPEGSRWFLTPDGGGALEGLQASEVPDRLLAPRDVRVAVDAAGLNFRDVLRSLGLIDTGLLGRELCGHVLEVGSDVTSVSVGDRVVALAFGTLGSEAVMHEELVAPAPPDVPTSQLATMPDGVCHRRSVVRPGEAEGRRAGVDSRRCGRRGIGSHPACARRRRRSVRHRQRAEAGIPARVGVKHVFDSRQTTFGQEILAATGGDGVHVLLNSLTGEGFIEASLSCLARGGRFVELSRVDIYSEEDMAAARPDVAYHILDLGRTETA